MKKLLIATALATLVACPLYAEDAKPLEDQKQKISYIIGVNLGRSWKGQDIDIDLDTLARGVKDVYSNAKLQIPDDEMKTVMQEFSKELRARAEQRRKEQGEKNLKAGEAFLAENKAKEGVTTLASGLQYKILKDGSGEKPKSNDVVKVHYRGTTIDGAEFDSSYQRDKPATFNVSGVIKGWTEALQLMKVGSKWQLVIPANLAYGEMGSGGGRIAPNATLIFDVELLGIEPPAPPPAPVTSDIIKVPSADEMKKGAKIEVIKKEDLEKKNQ
ncbi:MAG TPA: FKBP-type peptidyl-prolyl cis-trans isomerase [Candidatus Paceibacterota bacterium]|nr:FKBP-type peptidyl-prolyl cis-trans isomerase [Verrucomicrobiota bacterium]HRY47909.1 FKBP-type peptidyl-prolyl cis-trans isomerase [Candidatus Paceibacterota bacterium]HRZ99423.1 FKBP-type peptidyl-prolyl cis-trans isomerase [Candidatus Paceibacterota bacterium]